MGNFTKKAITKNIRVSLLSISKFSTRLKNNIDLLPRKNIDKKININNGKEAKRV